MSRNNEDITMSKRARQYIGILAARCLFGVLLIANVLVFWKRVLPVYKKSFAE